MRNNKRRLLLTIAVGVLAFTPGCDTGSGGQGVTGDPDLGSLEREASAAREPDGGSPEVGSDLSKAEAKALAAIEAVAAEEPDPEKFELIGYVRGKETRDALWVHRGVEVADDVEKLVRDALDT